MVQSIKVLFFFPPIEADLDRRACRHYGAEEALLAHANGRNPDSVNVHIGLVVFVRVFRDAAWLSNAMTGTQRHPVLRIEMNIDFEDLLTRKKWRSPVLVRILVTLGAGSGRRRQEAERDPVEQITKTQSVRGRPVILLSRYYHRVTSFWQ